jgi:hypothetical protein
MENFDEDVRLFDKVGKTRRRTDENARKPELLPGSETQWHVFMLPL